MYEESPFCTPPPNDAVLWRYMDFTKFVSVLDKRALFFSAADKFGDPFEGSVSKVTVELRSRLHSNIPPDTLRTFAQSLKETRRFTLISCWHENSHESEAMWKLYAREADGIVIKTDFDSLKRSFTCGEGVTIGRVSYVDYESAIIPEDNVLSPFLHKRKSFEHELEVRAIHILHSDDEISKFREEEIGGAYYEVDLSLLIKEVIVAPFAPDWFIELVKSVAALYGLKMPVVESTLADSPTWG